MKPQFEVGENLIYETVFWVEEEIIKAKATFTVESIEYVDNDECYVVSKVDQISDPLTEEMIETGATTSYINKENGEIVKIDLGPDSEDFSLEDSTRVVEGNGMYAPWMLDLEEGVKWSHTITSSKNFAIIYEYDVGGKEKIGDRECFKVEVTIFEKSPKGESEKTNERLILWVDTNKRILVRLNGLIGDLKIMEMNLISKT